MCGSRGEGTGCAQHGDLPVCGSRGEGTVCAHFEVSVHRARQDSNVLFTLPSPKQRNLSLCNKLWANVTPTSNAFF